MQKVYAIIDDITLNLSDGSDHGITIKLFKDKIDAQNYLKQSIKRWQEDDYKFHKTDVDFNKDCTYISTGDDTAYIDNCRLSAYLEELEIN